MGSTKLFRIILIALLGLSGVLSIYFYVATDFQELSNAGSTSGLLIYWSYLLIFIATAATLAFSTMGMIKNPKNAKTALIGIVGIVVVCVLGYVFAGDEVFTNINGEVMADASTSKKSEAGLIAFYILIVVAIGSIIYAEVSKMFK